MYYQQGASASFHLSSSDSVVLAASSRQHVSASQHSSVSRASPLYAKSPAFTPQALGGASLVSPSDRWGVDTPDDAAGGASPIGRVSRHIPQRDENTSARFDFAAHRNHAAAAGAAKTHSSSHAPVGTADVNGANGVLDRLAARTLGSGVNSGDILRFSRSSPLGRSKQDQVLALRALTGRAAGGAASNKLVLSKMPFRILDAPNVRPFPQVLDWGTNNRVAVALGEQIFVWDANTNQANMLCDMQGSLVRSVRWMQAPGSPDFIVAAIDRRTVQILDAETAGVVGALTMPTGPSLDRSFGSMRDRPIEDADSPADAVSVAISGPIIVAATQHHSHNVATFDVRQPRPLIRAYEAHDGATCVSFLGQEPFYIASGGEDGTVSVWDVRKSTDDPHYTFANVGCRSSITALRWASHKRSLIYAGTASGDLCLIDTHLVPHRAVVHRAPTGNAVTGLAVSKESGHVVSSHAGGADPRGGHVQVRARDNLAPISEPLCAVNNTQDIVALSLSPDDETVVTAQMDEALKFWKAFNRAPVSRTPIPNGANFDECLR